MKTIIKFIILISIVFSTQFLNNSNADYIENLFDLDTGVEKAELNLAKIRYINLNSTKYTRIQNQLKKADEYIKVGIIRLYKNGEFGYYQTQGIVKNYNNFVYYVNNFLYYLKQKEYYPNSHFIDDEILENYKNIKIFYSKVKLLTSKRNLN